MNVTLICHLTLDGVMQAPGGVDEDLREGFPYGGWAAPYGDRVMSEVMAKGMAQSRAGGSALLFGRRTYEHFHKVWPGRTDNPFTEVLDNTQKFVASRTLKAPLPWKNSTLLAGDAADAVAKMKAEGGPDLGILGSGALAQALMRHGLIDAFLLTIHPLALGTGRRLLPQGGPHVRFELAEVTPTTTGVLIARYRLASDA